MTSFMHFTPLIILALLLFTLSSPSLANYPYFAPQYNGNLTSDTLDCLARRAKFPSIEFCEAGTILPIGSYTPIKAFRSDYEKDRIKADLENKRKVIREAVKHAWDGYATYAWGYDELLPITETGQDTFASGLGTTIIDSLSTLYLMGGLDGRYETARNWVAHHLDFNKVGRIIVFETVIRILGGLLSMYHLSGDRMYLEKAEDLGIRLAASFDTPLGLPWPRCYLNETGRCENHDRIGESLYLAEVGSVQLEYRALAHHSTEPLIRRMRDVTERIIKHLQEAESSVSNLVSGHSSLLPYALSLSTGKYNTNLITLGAPADSYFEYLVKVWVQGGKTEQIYWDLFATVVDSIIEVCTHTTSHGDTIVIDILPTMNGQLQFNHKMDHFSCYIPGMIILGLDGLKKEEVKRRKRWEQLAESLTETCYKMYKRSPSGLAGEHIRLGNRGEWKMSGGYFLRPEAVEAFFYMYRHTKNPKYRKYAWSVFEKIEEHCKCESAGYSTLKSAKSYRPKKNNVMNSFLISETFKYIYLIFGDNEEEFPLDRWVFNTEAHPLLITPGLTDEKGAAANCKDSSMKRENFSGHDEL